MSCDRLSELPDSLIFDIFQFLPISDVVRTTFLSKRWNNLWTTFPFLIFNDRELITDSDKFRNFINGVVNSWRGIKITGLSFDLVGSDPKLKEPYPSDNDIASWMHFATEKNVEALIYYIAHQFEVPQFLYSCSSLKVLKLILWYPQIHGNVQWDRLKKLTIVCIGFTQNTIDQILRGSPRLELFDLTLGGQSSADTREYCSIDLSIRSSSLMHLILCYKKDGGNIDPELRIWTPNLQILYIGGIPYRKCLLINVSSLLKVSIDIRGFPNEFPGTEFVGETLTRIFPTFKHVQFVIFTNWCIKSVGAMKSKHYLSPLPIAIILRLVVSPKEYKHIVVVLELFPNLRNLYIDTIYKNCVAEHAESLFEFDHNLPDWFLQLLVRVDVIGDDSIFPLIQILLKYATNLVVMDFTLEKGKQSGIPCKSLFMVSLKLLEMEISSPNANLVFRSDRAKYPKLNNTYVVDIIKMP
ncbi:F-box/LRR-repeat protein At3g26922-like isoform X1 [Salvia miltiorrhiza]|uniref:F-box/LRR-repeat protein At3g26922-like isoform X1 n=1 Tax=Salvia miltiorrhiza TaxID=226208 RepID=UPI0025ACDAC0|nr:F-box/LRR-repeat protein At3g26922-like isoform X1 [Salvia miltiorrhiza]XP_057789327.1 F-box/LRR-repeat protein At3g26922-like isoform X1 [Salvia miltiorrhiza]